MTANTSEFEIKLLFPADRRKEIEQYLIVNGGVRRQHLQAAYIDTHDFVLMKAGIAFRLRKEGGRWIQTLKASTSNVLERIEHNVVLPASGSALPVWNVSLHKDHKAGKALNKVLSKSNINDLRVVYETDIWRRRAVIHANEGCVEYALDCGFIQSETHSGLAKTPVEELEIELKEGSPNELFDHARGVIQKYGAYIDVRSKSERGFLLANNLQFSPPAKGKGLPLKHAKNKQEIIRTLVDACLSQILSNQSVLNASGTNYTEYLHQLRVGLRRFKVLLKYLEKSGVKISQDSASAFKKVFSELGQYRDNNFVLSVLNPILSSLGGPEIKLKSLRDLPNPSAITRKSDFQFFLIEAMLIGLAELGPSQIDNGEADPFKEVAEFKELIEDLLESAFKNFSQQVVQFSTLEDVEIHELRKKMKFMRYSLDFFKDNLSKKKFSKFYKSTAVALEHFGLFNDICVCIHRIEGWVDADSNLLFALGWLKAERERVKSVCQKSAKNLTKQSVPWE